MKLIFATIVALHFHLASAQENVSYIVDQQDIDFAACEQALPIAVLAKDNMPYWSAPTASSTQKAICYKALKAFVQVANVEEIAQLEEEYEGSLRIFTNDNDFAAFINEQSTHKAAFIVKANNDSMIPVFKPANPVFFKK